MIRGPVEIIPPVEVEVVTRRAALPLDENEGIYVRNVKNGKVGRIEFRRGGGFEVTGGEGGKR